MAGGTPLLPHGHTAVTVCLSYLSAQFNFMFRSSGLEMLMTCKLLSNIELEIERQEGFLSTCTDLLMEMSAPKWIAEIVVSPLFSFPFLDSHCGVRTFLTRVLAST